MYKLVFAPEFARDLDSTFEYISHVLCADKAAKELMKEIDDSIMNLKICRICIPNVMNL